MPKPAPRHLAREEHVPPLGFRIWRNRGHAAMTAAHSHSDIEVNFLTSGRMTYLSGGKVTSVQPLRFTVLWGGIPHCTITSDRQRDGIWITLPLAWILRWNLPHQMVERLFAGDILDAPVDGMDQPLLMRWLEDFSKGGADLHRILLLEIEARFHRFALATTRRRKAKAGGDVSTGLHQVERITEYIAQHYREPLAVQQIAHAMGFHGKYLMHLFKKHSGMSIWEYVTRVRLSHAQRLLLTTDLKILDIALASGFASIGPFYRAFNAYSPKMKKPLEYRRKLGIIG